MRVAVAFLVALLAGCDDGVIDRQSLPGEVANGPTGEPSTAPSFVADPGSGRRVLASGTGVAEDEIDLTIWANWIDLARGEGMNSADFVLRIDPGSEAQVVWTGGGDWCASSSIEVTPTGNPGEWRMRRLPGSECACGPWSPWDYYGGFVLAEVRLKIGSPGSWSVEIEPVAPLCDCSECLHDVVFGGGTLTDAPPS
jgi:hypothetical protein